MQRRNSAEKVPIHAFEPNRQAAASLAALIGPTLAMLAVLTAAAFSVYSTAVLAPEVGASLDADPKLIGPYTAVIYLVAAVTGAFTGRLIRGLGAIRTCQITLLAAAAGLLLGASGWLFLIAISTAFFGFAYGPFNPASAHVLSGLATPRWRPLVFSIKQLGVPLGGALAGSLTPLMALSYGWQGAVLTIAAVNLMVAIAIEPLRARFDTLELRRAVPLTRGVLAPIRLVLGNHRLRWYTWVAFTYAGSQLCLASMLVVYLHEALALDIAAAGLVLASMQIGGVFGRIVWGAIAGQLLSPGIMLMAVGVVNALCIAVLSGYGPEVDYGLLCLTSFVLGSVALGWNGIVLSEVVTHAPAGRQADATAGVQMVMFGGVVSFPVLFYQLVQTTRDYTLAFAMLIVVMGLGLLGLSRLVLLERAARPEVC
ncbi:MAG: MFS transporter [Gammaproteobacteria bacterium]|nr:MFS transporter [Gammaproteobacteria bacterium]